MKLTSSYQEPDSSAYLDKWMKQDHLSLNSSLICTAQTALQ